jgi:hypothetical protein
MSRVITKSGVALILTFTALAATGCGPATTPVIGVEMAG